MIGKAYDEGGVQSSTPYRQKGIQGSLPECPTRPQICPLAASVEWCAITLQLAQCDIAVSRQIRAVTEWHNELLTTLADCSLTHPIFSQTKRFRSPTQFAKLFASFIR